MKIVTPLTAAIVLFALTACGDEASTDSSNAGQERRVEVEQPASADKPVQTAESIPEVVEEPEPEPEDAVIAFRGEDGELALARDSLEMVSPVHDAENDVWSVFVKLDEAAAEKFYTLTTKTSGEALPIVIDGMIVAAPVLENPVYGGGFVFDVDNGDVASTVFTALTGQEQTFAMPQEIAAEDALPDDAEEPTEDVANVESDDESSDE